MKKERINISIDKDIHKEAKNYAKSIGVSLSSLIAFLLSKEMKYGSGIEENKRNIQD